MTSTNAKGKSLESRRNRILCLRASKQSLSGERGQRGSGSWADGDAGFCIAGGIDSFAIAQHSHGGIVRGTSRAGLG